MMDRALLIFSFLTFHIVFGQGLVDKPLRVKIIIDSHQVSEINVVNLNNKETITTNPNGELSILAKVNDVLVLSVLNSETYKIIVGSDDVKSGIIVIKMSPMVTKLNEVIINNKSLNVLSLGIVTKAPVTYTTAERRLQTAGDFKAIMLLSMLGGGMPLDPLINKINGRTKRLKKLVVLEKKESNIKVISELFKDGYFTDKLNIPTENINGFKFYIVENENFVKILDSKNELQISFYMTALSEEFKTLLNGKN